MSRLVYFFPRSSGSTILGVLDNVDCSKKNTTGGWGPNHLTSIHVAMLKLSDVDVAKKLWSLDNAGCVVHVVRTMWDPPTTPRSPRSTTARRTTG